MFEEKENFSLLAGDNLDYVNKHRWPPLSYVQAMEEYREKYAEELEGGEDVSPVSVNRSKKRTRERCKVM